ncbi:Membrane-anchored ubiquitin-fold protein 5 [Capsicum annuum]|nr:Membrane-anchored ubiquitin-fold protein 5 [Capsicum annuum]
MIAVCRLCFLRLHRLAAQVWDKDSGPKTINDVKLINAGRILENNKTLGESRLPVAEVPGGVITMHVVVRPPMNEKARDKLQDDSLKKGGCACTIL